MAFCTGRGTPFGEHCCWWGGKVCPFLEKYTVEGRRFACGLRRELGSWEAVHADPRYQPVQEFWDTREPQTITSCGDWQPDSGTCCREVAVVINGNS